MDLTTLPPVAPNTRFLLQLVLVFLFGFAGLSPAAAESRLTIVNSFPLAQAKFSGITMAEFSGLAWDQDEQVLYAVNDRGQLFHFSLSWNAGGIEKIEPIRVFHLLDQKGRRFSKKSRDSEGLIAGNHRNGRKGDTELAISFEGVPRIVRFRTNGRFIGQLPLHVELQNRHNLRGGNNGLESLTFHPKWGFITAPEISLKTVPRTAHTIYARNRRWTFPVYPQPNSGITAMEALPSGRVLVMERAWNGLMKPLVVAFRLLDFNRCNKQLDCAGPKRLKVLSTTLVPQNYEGLTRLDGKHFLAVTDNAGRNYLSTLFTLLRLD